MFKIGEIVIYIGRRKIFYGYEVEIVKGPYIDLRCPEQPSYDFIVPGYPCDALNSENAEWAAWESRFRKRKPPQELSTWEEIQKLTNWNPSHEKAANRITKQITP